MTWLRLIADDLTGALDSAAAFSSVLGPIDVDWVANRGWADGSRAVSTGTREQDTGVAAVAAAEAAKSLWAEANDATLAFFKVDSLLRGHAGAELAAILKARPFARVIIATALPFQGRICRNGRQHVRISDGWLPIGEDLAQGLRDAGFGVSVREAGMTIPEGISLWNSTTDADLDALVQAALPFGGPLLWVGTAGLAGALARHLGPAAGRAAAPHLPLLGLIGTDHPVMSGQIARIGQHHVRLGDDAPGGTDAVRARLAADGICFVTCDLPAHTPRQAATEAIAARLAALCRALDRPNTLFVSGGETLSALGQRLGATSLRVHGEFEPGIPCSQFSGGLWDGLTLYSKSGAFGAPDVLSRLISASVQEKAC